MGCCGLISRRKRHGKDDEVPTETLSHSSPKSPPSITRRGSLNSLQSGQSVYYDANEEPEGAASVSYGNSPLGSSEAETSSPANGQDALPEESRGPEEAKGPLSALMDLFTRRPSMKSRPSGQTAEPGVVDEVSTKGGSGCLSALGSLRERDSSAGPASFAEAVPSFRPFAGASFKRGEQVGSTEGVECWQVADATTFNVRGPDYDTTKKKIASRGAVYRLVGVDAYSFEKKIYHIAQHIQLPEAPKTGPDHSRLPPDQRLPPLLVINIQLPLYKASLIGTTDGKGVSLVYYFGLPEGFELNHVENDAAVALIQRFFQDSKEENGEMTRDRLKLIARVVNVEQWAKEGPLSNYEHSLLNNYNDKPILTRPQHQFFTGENYLEIDLDVHNYAWLARKVFGTFIPRLGPVVFENAFVVQGNRPEELPEVVLACARVSRLDMYKVQPFPATLRKTKSHRTTVELDPDHPPLVSHTFPDDLTPRPPGVDDPEASKQ